MILDSAIRLFAAAVLLAAVAGSAKSQDIESAGVAPPSCSYGAPAAGYEDSLSDFAFLIGDFSVVPRRWEGGQWSAPRKGAPARWSGEYTLDGKGIRDVWYGRDPGASPGAPVGVNVRIFDTERGVWEMMWLHTVQKTVQHMRAWRTGDGRLLMEQVYPAGRDFLAEFQILDNDNWQRIHYERGDTGKWQPSVLLGATRIPCD